MPETSERWKDEKGMLDVGDAAYQALMDKAQKQPGKSPRIRIAGFG